MMKKRTTAAAAAAIMIGIISSPESKNSIYQSIFISQYFLPMISTGQLLTHWLGTSRALPLRSVKLSWPVPKIKVEKVKSILLHSTYLSLFEIVAVQLPGCQHQPYKIFKMKLKSNHSDLYGINPSIPRNSIFDVFW